MFARRKILVLGFPVLYDKKEKTSKEDMRFKMKKAEKLDFVVR